MSVKRQRSGMPLRSEPKRRQVAALQKLARVSRRPRVRDSVLECGDPKPLLHAAITWGWLFALGLCFAISSLLSAAELRVVDLKCGYATNPLGVDDPQPSLSWCLESDVRGARQTAWQVLVASDRSLLVSGKSDLWDSGRMENDRTTQIPYGGRQLHSSRQVFWQVRAWDQKGEPSPWSEPATWTMGLLSADEWNGSKIFVGGMISPRGQEKERGEGTPSTIRANWVTSRERAESLLLRREFSVTAGIKRALLHVTGLGQYEATLNGVKVGADLLSPGWTNYRRSVLYDTHDVTPLLRAGANVIGLTLGAGMYRVERPTGRFAKFVGSFGPLRAIAQLKIEYEDGSATIVGTDEQWRTHVGPITFSSIYGGEDYDARLLPVGWDAPGFDATGWLPVVVTADSRDVLRGTSHAAEPLRAIETREPVARRRLGDGAELFDFGQNASFMPRLRLSGPAGSTVRLTPGEVVKADGTIERGTMGGAHRGSAWWSYTKATDGEETWFPQFYYVGSRYVHAELIPADEPPSAKHPSRHLGGLPKIESLQMVIVHSTAEPVGEFATSNPLLNRIHDLVRWAQRSNMVSILTDCPHREKLGWIEQYHLNGPSIRYEYDVTRLYAKGMADMAEAQTPAGLIPNIAPEYVEFKEAFRDAAEWGAAFMLVPWQQYEFTGNPSLLRAYYEPMKRYFAYLENQAKDEILSNGLGDWYDYAPGAGKRANLTPAPITATAFFHEDARRLALAAERLSRVDDAVHFRERAAAIRAAYVKRFRRDDGLYGTASQASLAIPLVLGLVEPGDRERVVNALVRDVEEKGYASAGDIGFRFLLRALADAGRSDVVYQLINQDEKPGYGYQLKRGATALTEAWDANPNSSHNHFMLGQVVEWFYADLAGIAPDPEAAGFKNTIVRPQPVGDLTWVEASHRTPQGWVRVRWEKLAGKFVLDLVVPPNSTATVYLPASDSASVREGARAVADSAGVTFLRREKDRDVFAVESGHYNFQSNWP